MSSVPPNILRKPPIQYVDLGVTEATDQIKCAVVGKEKSGKSTLVSTARTPILFLDYDRRYAAIAGKKDVHAITIFDEPWPNAPTSIDVILDILMMLQQSECCLDPIAAKYNLPIQKGIKIKSIAHDSGNSLAKLALNYTLYFNKDLRHEVIIGGKLAVFTPRSWTGWGVETGIVEDLINRTFALGVDSYIIMHESAEEAVDSTNENPKFTGRITTYPVRYSRFLKNFNEVWRVEMAPYSGTDPKLKGKFAPQVAVMQNWAFNASTCLLLDPIEEPDIQKMLAKHEARKKAK